MDEELAKAMSIPTCVLYGHQWRREYPHLSSDPTKADTLICVGCGTRKPARERKAPRTTSLEIE